VDGLRGERRRLKDGGGGNGAEECGEEIDKQKKVMCSISSRLEETLDAQQTSRGEAGEIELDNNKRDLE